MKIEQTANSSFAFFNRRGVLAYGEYCHALVYFYLYYVGTKMQYRYRVVYVQYRHKVEMTIRSETDG